LEDARISNTAACAGVRSHVKNVSDGRFDASSVEGLKLCLFRRKEVYAFVSHQLATRLDGTHDAPAMPTGEEMWSVSGKE
jgi:hypothetical protein